jgi:hypothetical protein
MTNVTEKQSLEAIERMKAEAPAARERMKVPGFHMIGDIIRVMAADGEFDFTESKDGKEIPTCK